MKKTEPSRESRARAYLWFARAFSYPDKERYEEMRILAQELIDLEELKDEMERWMDQLDSLNFQDVEADFVNLFISGFPTTIAPPYESVYRNNGLVMGPTTEDVIEMYAKYQLEPAEESSLPDSLPIELEFIAFLLENYPDSRDLTYFFREHILSWIDEFLDRVGDSGIPLFVTLSRMLRKFIDQEKDLIK